MAAKVQFLVEVTHDGKGFQAAIVGAEKLDKAQQKVKQSGAALADTVGRVSTSLARSVGVFGLSSTSLRALDDAAEIAELGLKGIEGGFRGAGASAIFFNAAAFGLVAAVAAVATAFGTFLRWLGETEFGMKTLGLSTKELDADFRRLFGVVEAGSNKAFAAGMGAKFEAGVKQQVAALQSMKLSVDDIVKGTGLKQLLAPLTEGDQIAKLKEMGFSLEEIKRILPALTDNLKVETDAQREAAAATKQHAEAIKKWLDVWAGADLAKESAELNEAFSKIGPLAAVGDAQLMKMGDDMLKLADAGQSIPGLTAVFSELARRGLEPAAIAARELGKEIGPLKSAVGIFAGLATFVPGQKQPFAFGAGTTVDLLAKAKKDLGDVKQKEIEAAREAERWSGIMQGIAMIAGTLGGTFGDLVGIIGNIADAFHRAGEEQDQALAKQMKFNAIAGAAGQIGGMIGGTAGSAIQGAAGGAMAGFAIGGPVGAVVGGLVGALGGIFGNAKKKAEELKRKQAEAIQSFTDLYNQWVQMRRDIAVAGAEGVNKLVGALFDENGKFTEGLTTAANAADYVAASFATLRASGMSVVDALLALGPALDAMLKDPSKFKGTAAEPLIQMAKFAQANEKLLAFIDGLGDAAIALATFGMLTQEMTDKIAGDLANAFQKLIDGGLSYDQALAFSAQTLYDLEQAAKKSGTTLDAHTQKLIDDARAAGLFEGLQDPMERLVELNSAMVVAMGTLITLFGGAVPAAVQKMIDEFNNAQIPSDGAPGPGEPSGEPVLPEPPDFQHGSGGLRDFGRGTRATLHGPEGVFTKQDILDMLTAAAAGGGGGDFRLYLDGSEVAKSTARHNRKNHGGTLTQQRRGRR